MDSDKIKIEQLENQIKSMVQLQNELLDSWAKTIRGYQDIAHRITDNSRNHARYTSKALAVRDCHKDLLKLQKQFTQIVD